MLTVLEIIKRTTDFLAGKGVENARLNAELLVGHALGLKRMQLYMLFERPLSEPELETIRPLVRRRGAREPLQYIVGEMEFFGVNLKIDRRALIPRPETEHLLALITEKLSAAPARILDLGTGSGAIALGLARHYPEAKVTAFDVSAEAVELTRENIARNQLADRVTALQSDWFSALDAAARFELVVSNPPYLTAAEAADTAAEIRQYEPSLALTPGVTGMEALTPIIAGARDRLETGGWLALETGIAQHAALAAQLAAQGYTGFESVADLTGRPRFVFARRP
ncbi:MAG: peptide chain release factor N(5)-glutamine methyltransferase [Opitutaceae bacterium]|nr:peptide chain release factor N(5)-glutamine methyltransferase [Opitutaceae bacterium]